MPRRTAQQCSGVPSPSAVITAPRDTPFSHSVQLLLMLTGKAKSAQITRDKKCLCNASILVLVPVCSSAAVL